ncbi:uncharacterized protein YcsI (UPF0317 family) [Tamaricihabitans halophyticus]|uniref:Uncharacterized protein YcsI (UPF0317 family) n=1 Tax=Tamaricihabitans halophyticus TaxID=1262583 RepID=A0A4V6NRE4_9PSEU|nr:putative hydro-lyase [Tamaricihabitans halophyticus]TCP54966.1 uncharacterized protein YcsI (UPF0317 family) [Tamaricihabitans halophyticus]
MTELAGTDYAAATPAEIRAMIRDGRWTGTTTGACAGWMQANLAIVPATLAEDFHQVCRLNPQALPLLERTEPGAPDALRSAPGADLRTDLSGYHVHRDGQRVTELAEITEVWRDDLVGFLLGCSFSAEEALHAAGVRLRHLELGQGVPMYLTNVECSPSGPFAGPIVVSMRPIANSQLELARETTERLPLAHGGPVHIGDPAELGIADLDAPDWGERIALQPDETPVFWACGVTPQSLLRTAKPPFAITHAPGHMFLTDIRVADIEDRTEMPPSTHGESR